MPSKTSIKALADKIARRLHNAGFVVHRYDARSSSSVYLKLDYGANNSIRIGDHRGKNYPYRFNIGPWIKRREDQYGGKFIRGYYTPDDLECLIADVVRARYEKKRLYGERHYQRQMEKLRSERHDAKGFWRYAYRVK